ncbi:MAG: CBS domain-containing protein [Solirubrobacteraceae bacterium]|nr:CBS domain-containing protein [Solirubrobacteraceae bacterium]
MIDDGLVLRDVPTVRDDDDVGHATQVLLRSGLPALPVVDGQDRLVGIFGERECITAIFPGYLDQLTHLGFVPRTLDVVLERDRSSRDAPVAECMNKEHVDVSPAFSALQIAETFLHHRVSIVPVVDRERIQGIVTRKDFFQAAAGRFLG